MMKKLFLTLLFCSLITSVYAIDTITDYFTGTGASSNNYWEAAGAGISQGFKVSTTDNVTKFSFQLWRTTDDVGTLTGYIYSDDGSGKPNASLATFSAVDVSTLGTSAGWVDFTGTFTPTANTQYHIVIWWTSGGATDEIWWYYNNGSGHTTGNFGIKQGAGAWSVTADRSGYFRVYQDITVRQRMFTFD